MRTQRYNYWNYYKDAKLVVEPSHQIYQPSNVFFFYAFPKQLFSFDNQSSVVDFMSKDVFWLSFVFKPQVEGFLRFLKTKAYLTKYCFSKERCGT